MFRIDHNVGPFGECRLVDSTSDAEVRIAPERGGMVVGFRLAGRELLYLDVESFLDPARSVRGGIPILFPMSGNLPEDSYRVEGEVYQLPQHGFARRMVWRVSDESTTDAASLTLALASTPETRASYPFDFTVRFCYRLAGSTLTIAQHYLNHSERPLPVAAGFHPYFPCLDKQRLLLDLPATRYIDQVSGATGQFGPLPLDAPAIDWIFTDVHGQKASLTSPADGYRITLSYDPLFAFLVFWTLAGKDFVCLEPWMAPRNALNTGDHLQLVPPGGTLTTEISILGELL